MQFSSLPNFAEDRSHHYLIRLRDMPGAEEQLKAPRDERDRGCFDVLIVEGDTETREEYSTFLTTLGYHCHLAADGTEALQVIAMKPAIGVVVTDLELPSFDGLSLLSELQARFAFFRSLIPIVVTRLATTETAVEAMRLGAIDFLAKPASPAALAAAMRRASARWTFLDDKFRMLNSQESSSSTASLISSGTPPRMGAPEPDRETLQQFVRSILRARQRRSEFMDASKFADPAWDIMLDLTSAALEGRSVPAFSVSVAANVPITTALRYVKRLVEDRVVKRWEDPDDKRRTLLALEADALEQMLRYLSNVWKCMADDFAAWS